MSGYNTFENGTPAQLHRRNRSASNTSSLDQSDESSAPPPHLYASVQVSRALITAFGLPTLIEYEPPSATNVVASEEESQEPLRTSSQFEPVKKSHFRAQSLPATSVPTPSLGGSYQSQHRQSLSRLSIFRTTSHDESTTHNHLYTYRVRTFDKEDEHHILMCQNPDGTYSHANADGEPLAASTYGADDTTGEGLMLSSSMDLKGSVSLDAMTHLEDTLSHLEDMPPHIHPEVPAEMLNPQFTQTIPALKLWPLAVLVFYNVSGGPFGIEPSIRAGGNFYAILGFLLFPLVWSVPEALVTAELGSAFQDPSAGVAWVEEAFGESMGSMCGYLGWVSGATDNAIYPTLFLEYVTSVAGWDKEEFSGWTRFGYVAMITSEFYCVLSSVDE